MIGAHLNGYIPPGTPNEYAFDSGRPSVPSPLGMPSQYFTSPIEQHSRPTAALPTMNSMAYSNSNTSNTTTSTTYGTTSCTTSGTAPSTTSGNTSYSTSSTTTSAPATPISFDYEEVYFCANAEVCSYCFFYQIRTGAPENSKKVISSMDDGSPSKFLAENNVFPFCVIVLVIASNRLQADNIGTINRRLALLPEIQSKLDSLPELISMVYVLLDLPPPPHLLLFHSLLLEFHSPFPTCLPFYPPLFQPVLTLFHFRPCSLGYRLLLVLLRSIGV